MFSNRASIVARLSEPSASLLTRITVDSHETRILQTTTGTVISPEFLPIGNHEFTRG